MNRTVPRAIAILKSAITEVADNIQPLFLALVLPAIGSTIVLLLWMELGHLQIAQWLLLAASVFFYALFATSCHRIILLGSQSLPNRYGIYWSLRETRFAGWLIIIGIIYGAISTPFQVATMHLPQVFHDWQLSWYLPVFAASYFEGRISMVLPATAVDQKLNVAGSWYLTRGRGMAIAMALFATILVMDFLTVLTERVLFKDLIFVGRTIGSLLVFPFIALAVAILSVVYREVSSVR